MDVLPEDILWYVTSIRTANQRGGLLDTVNCIFNIVFNANPKSFRTADLEGGWILRTTPLLNVLYDDQRKCANKSIDLVETDFDAYYIQRNNWRVRSNKPFFRPTAETITNIMRILHDYGNPTNPVPSSIRPKRRYPKNDRHLLQQACHRTKPNHVCNTFHL